MLLSGIIPRQGILNQLSTGLIASLCALLCGMINGWTSPNIEGWLRGDDGIKMTVNESSWVISIVGLGSVIPLALAGFIDRLGRKTFLLTVAPFSIISWIIVIFTRSVTWLYVVRILQGYPMGMVFVMLPVYQSEISENSIRGVMGIMLISGYNIGILLEYVLGTYLAYNTVAYINISIPIIFLILFSTKPESPHYLVMKKRQPEALKALSWFRGVEPSMAEQELREITMSIENENSLKGEYRDIFATYAMRRAICIVFTVEIVQLFSGNSAILALASYIFNAAGKSFLPSEDFSIIMAVVQVCAIFFVAPTIDHLGRRVLLLCSITACGICQGIVAIFFYMKTITDVSSFTWTPVIFFSIYFFFNAVGTGSMVGLLTAELFPTHLRGKAAQIGNLLGLIASSLTMKIYQSIAESVGFYVNHLIFTCVCVVGFVIIYVFLPETKGLSFDEINERLSRRNKKS